MPFGRSKKDKNGVFRHVCLNPACDKRVDKERKKSNIIDRNYCAWHQDINHYFNDDLERIKEPPKKFFSNPDNVKRMIEKIFKKENIETNKEIYDCNRSIFVKYISSIYQHVDNVAQGIITLFPEKNLKWYYFNPIPSGILDIEDNRRELFDAFLSDNNIDINSDNIYNIELKLLESHKACTLSNYYKHSVYDIIKNLYPNRELIPWYFKGLNNYFINQDSSFNIDNIKKWFMYEIYTKYNFSEELSEYDKIHNILLTINGDLLLKTTGGSFILNHLSGSLYKFIDKIYPEYNIKPWDLTSNKFNQILYACINNLCIKYKFDTKNIEYEKSYQDLYHINLLRFDACLNITINNKDYCINFEKDGIQHFEAVDFFGGEDKFVIQRNRDVKKNTYINSNDNLYLIRISYLECINNYLFNKVLNELFEELYTNIKLNKNIKKKIYVSNLKLYEYLF
jgi:hypothetical protein